MHALFRQGWGLWSDHKPHFSGVHVQGQLREKQVLQVYHKARPALSPLKFFHRPFAYHSFGTWHQTPPRKHFLTQPPLSKKKRTTQFKDPQWEMFWNHWTPLHTLLLRVSNYFLLSRALSLLFQKALQTLQEQAPRAQLYRILMWKSPEDSLTELCEDVFYKPFEL